MNSQVLSKILQSYESDNPGTRANLFRLLNQGQLGGTGRLLILPVDQGFEHGPGRSFAMNPDSYDPHYHFRLAIEAGLSGLAAPLGFLEAGAHSFAGHIPLILKLNNAHSLIPSGTAPTQALTGSVRDALRLGCVAVGLTLYPGSDYANHLFEQFQSIAHEAKSVGLVVVAWAYPRGNLSKSGETAVDVVAYGAHIAALLGAHIIKVKLPHGGIEQTQAAKAYQNIDIDTLQSRVRHVVSTGFQGRRLVIFSGGLQKEEDSLFQDITAIAQGGGSGSIIGRNIFQRPRDRALALIHDIVNIYRSNPVQF